MMKTKQIITILLLLIIGTVQLNAQSTRRTPGDSDQPDYNPGAIEKVLEFLDENMVRVEGGTYLKGASHVSTTVKTFYCCRYETIQYLWQVLMGENPTDVELQDPMKPVVRVGWNECQQFIQRLNSLSGKRYRLLTEDEWEFAARGGNLSLGYIYAGSNILDQVAWYADNAEGIVHRVGMKQPNELGLYDMNGNVEEWCEDSIPSNGVRQRRRTPVPDLDDLNDPDIHSVDFGVYHRIRGGSIYSDVSDCTILASWEDCDNFGHYESLGFRIAADVQEYEEGKQTFKISINWAGFNTIVSQDIDHIGYDPQANSFLFPYTEEDGSLAYQAFDIKNVNYITRESSGLSYKEGEELEQAIVDKIYNSNDSPESIAKALKANNKVAEAYTEDGQNVVVRFEGDSVVTVYAVRQLEDPFTEKNYGNNDDEGMARRLAPASNWPATGKNGKVVVFNFYEQKDLRGGFESAEGRDGQNRLLHGMLDELSAHGYGIEYYCGSDFTGDELRRHVQASQNDANNYQAIFVMSEGMIINGRSSRSFFATGEEVTTPNKPVDSYKLKDGRSYHICQVTSLGSANPNCLLYVGSCFAFDEDGILPRNTYVGWKGGNVISQAHATLLIHRMLMR